MCAPRDSYLYESRHNICAAQQHLLRDLPNQRHEDPFNLMCFYQIEQVLAKNLEDHADVNAIWVFISEVIGEEMTSD